MMDVEALTIARILAPSPVEATSLIPLRLNAAKVKMIASRGQTNRVFEMFYNVAGIPPPVNNIGYFERNDVFPDHWGGARHAHALFSGIKRPFNDDNEDGEVCIDVLEPKFVYRYCPSMICVAKRESAPHDSVFVVYVIFDVDNRSGEILNWEWVTSSEESPGLPEGYEARYAKRLW